MFKVAVAQTLNTAVIVSLVDFHAPPWLKDVTPAPLLRGDYADAVRGWYGSVGAAILLNMLLNGFSSNLNSMFFVALEGAKRRFRWWTKKLRHHMELQDLFTNPDFEISIAYAKLLTTVFCCMIYSSGLPLLYIFAALDMFMTYWTDKWVLLRHSKRPPAYDASMP